MNDTSTLGNGSAEGTLPLFPIEAKIGLTSAYIFIFAIALFGNLIGLYAVCTKAPSRRITDLLIKNLAAADLIFTITLMPLATISMHLIHPNLWIGGTFGNITCKLVFYAIPVSIAASVMTLAVISFDRLCAIFFPLSKMLFQNHKAITAIIWLLSLISVTPHLLLYQVSKVEDQYLCIQEWPWATSQEESYDVLRIFHVVAFIIMYAFPLLVISVVNSLVAHRIWFHKSPGADDRSHSNVSARVTRRRVVKLLIIIIIVFALCWMPTYAMHYLMFFQPDIFDAIPVSWVHLAFWISHANSAINPLLYIAFNKNFRFAFLDTVMALSFLPCHAVSACVVYLRGGRSISSHDQSSYQIHQFSRPRQQSGSRVVPATMAARKDTGNTLDTRL